MTFPTKKQTLQRMLDAYNAGTLGALKHVYAGGLGSYNTCVYSKGKRTCIVGSIFSPAQLAYIKRRRLMNEYGVYELAEHIGKKNIESVSGMSLRSLNTLQRHHDASDIKMVQAGTPGTPLYKALLNMIARA